MGNSSVTFFRRLVSAVRPFITRRFFYGYFYNLLCDFFSIKENQVLLESHHGKSFGGNPYYIAAHLVSTREYQNLRVIMVGPKHRSAWLRAKLKSKKIKVVKPRGLGYVYYLATSKWLISDVTFPVYFSRRDNQRYLNTWHGTPLKVLGRHTPGELSGQFVNSQRNFFQANFLLVPNDHFESVFYDSYCLSGLCDSKALRLGYPRNDPLSNDLNIRRETINFAFLPTWRGGISERQDSSRRQIQELVGLFDYLENSLPSTVIFWVKLHPLVDGAVDLSRYSSVRPFPECDETYEFLSTCDALVTDYSSVFFDFASTRKPIFRYVHDERDYETGRGFCLDPASLPFPCARTPSELLALVEGLVEGRSKKFGSGYSEFVFKFNLQDTGDSAKKVCDAFFGGGCISGGEVAKPATSLPRVAIFIGKKEIDLRIYYSLLEKMDVTRYSFTLLLAGDAITPEWEAFLLELPLGWRYVVVNFNIYASPKAVFSILFRRLLGGRSYGDHLVPEVVGLREYKRLFGDVRFDSFITFDRTCAGSRLLEHCRVWEESVCLTFEQVRQSDSASLTKLKGYIRC